MSFAPKVGDRVRYTGTGSYSAGRVGAVIARGDSGSMNLRGSLRVLWDDSPYAQLLWPEELAPESIIEWLGELA